MILKTLTLKNYRKFKYVTIEFPDGVIGIVGLNGVGKSTIFEAIAWVLYGSVAARTAADQIKRENAEPSDSCRVELDFVFEDNNYRIVREMTGKSLTVSATAVLDGKIAASGAETVSKFIQKKLGMDFKSFFTSIFAKQKELNVLSTMNASERRPLILKMLGIDAMDDIVKEIRSDKKNKELIIENLDKDLIDEAGKSKIKKYEEELKDYIQKKKEITLFIQQVTEKKVELIKKLKILKKNNEDKKIAYEKLNQYKDRLSDKKTIFELKKKIKEEIKNLYSKIEKRRLIIEKHKEKSKDLEHIEEELKNIELRLSTVNNETEKLVKIIEQKKTRLEDYSKNVKELDSKKCHIEKMGPDAKCPTCERILGDQHAILLNKFDKEKQEIKNHIETLQESREKFQEVSTKLLRERQALQRKNNYLQKLLREKEKIDTTIFNASKEILDDEKEIASKKTQLREIGPIEFDRSEYETVKKQIEDCYRKYQTALEIYTTEKDHLGASQVELEKKEGEKNLVAHHIKTLQQRIEEQNTYIMRIQQEKTKIQYLTMLSEIMSLFRTHLISRIRPTLSSYASDFFEQLTDGKYKEIELEEEYNLMVYDNGCSYTINRFSGGEVDLANLCLRLAISEIITERAGGIFNFIILDEIFGSQDVIRRQNIMKALNNLSSKFRQIFLITHVEDVKNYMEYIINVNESEDGSSILKIE